MKDADIFQKLCRCEKGCYPFSILFMEGVEGFFIMDWLNHYGGNPRAYFPDGKSGIQHRQAYHKMPYDIVIRK